MMTDHKYTNLAPADQTSSPRCVRRQLFVARRAQGHLMWHVVLYCLLCCATSAMFTYVLLPGTPTTGGAYRTTLAAVAAALVVLPGVLWDAARVSHRLVGPFPRVQGVVRRLARQERVPALVVRENDPWGDWIRDFNDMLSQVQDAPEPGANTSSSPPLRAPGDVA